MEVVWFAQVHPPGGAGLPVTPEPPSTVSGACFVPGAALGCGDPEGTPLSSDSPNQELRIILTFVCLFPVSLPNVASLPETGQGRHLCFSLSRHPISHTYTHIYKYTKFSFPL